MMPSLPDTEATVCPEAVELVPGHAASPVLVICDHATNIIPPEFGSLGLSPGALARHIAFDIGARGLALQLARRLGAAYVGSRFSRLLIDPNRGLDDPTLIMRLSDGAVIPGNAHLTSAGREARIARFYTPYHAAIEDALEGILAQGRPPIILSVHSFTETWRGTPRPWHCAILWDKDHRLALPLITALREDDALVVGDNEPYSGRLKNDCLYRHGTARGFPHALIEVRQDLIGEDSGQAAWADRLAAAVEAVLGDEVHSEALSEVAYFGSHTDL
jgi:predicted N-formylglutamate amidohydrolase